MSNRCDFRAMTRKAVLVSSGAALMPCALLPCAILGGLLFLSTP
jgi:hypothetical protein